MDNWQWLLPELVKENINMCLAIPGIVREIAEAEQKATIDYNGLTKTASTMLMPKTKIGDYVLVHAGFIIQIFDAESGEELRQLTEEMGLV